MTTPDPQRTPCFKCSEPSIGANEKGDHLCADCIAKELIEKQFGQPHCGHENE